MCRVARPFYLGNAQVRIQCKRAVGRREVQSLPEASFCESSGGRDWFLFLGGRQGKRERKRKRFSEDLTELLHLLNYP